MRSDEDRFNQWLDDLGGGRPMADPPAGSDELDRATSAVSDAYALLGAIHRARPWKEIVPMATAIAPVAPKPRRVTRRPLALLNSAVSIAAIIAVIASLALTAWVFQPGDDDGGGEATLQSLPALAGTPTNDTTGLQVPFDLPTPEECDVAPLTVDEVMVKIDQYADIDWSHPAEETAQIIEPDVYDALVRAQRRWMACKLYGTPFHVWALEANRLVRADVLALSAGPTGQPVRYDPHAVRADLETLLAEVGTEVSTQPVESEGAFFPIADPEYAQGFYNRQYGNFAADLTVWWIDQDGASLESLVNETTTQVFPRFLSADLYNTIRFAYDDANDTWLVHSFVTGRA